MRIQPLRFCDLIEYHCLQATPIHYKTTFEKLQRINDSFAAYMDKQLERDKIMRKMTDYKNDPELAERVDQLDSLMSQNKQEFAYHFGDIKFLYKIQNNHLNYLLSQRTEASFQQLKEALPRYLEMYCDDNSAKYFGTQYGTVKKDFQQRWNFWVRRLIQFKVLEDFLELIPREDTNIREVRAKPGSKLQFVLEIKTYTAIFEYLI